MPTLIENTPPEMDAMSVAGRLSALAKDAGSARLASDPQVREDLAAAGAWLERLTGENELLRRLMHGVQSLELSEQVSFMELSSAREPKALIDATCDRMAVRMGRHLLSGPSAQLLRRDLVAPDRNTHLLARVCVVPPELIQGVIRDWTERFPPSEEEVAAHEAELSAQDGPTNQED